MQPPKLPALALLFAIVILAMPGCSDPGVRRYQVSGEVTFKGNPVPKGFIIFEPDTTKGNSGPAGGATIVDGKYQTETGKGVAGGAYRVRITGYDGVAFKESGEDILDGRPLFANYHTSVEFPKESTTKDFAVPEKKS